METSLSRGQSTGNLARRGGGSARDLFAADLITREDTFKKKLRPAHMAEWAGVNSSWSTIARAYVADYVCLFAMIVVLAISEVSTPFERFIYTQEPLEYWRYSYPLNTRNTVPSWSVPLVSTLGPTIAFVAYFVIMRPSRLELHNTILTCWSAVFYTAVITNLVKLGVGRPRPSFMQRCWPGDQTPVFRDGGYAECAPDAVDPSEGRKSFPSGHTSWTTSGMGFLSFWLLGKLRCFDGSAHPNRIVLALIPLGLAVWVGITRMQDYWHHWEDVCAGFLLGLSVAYIMYRQLFPAPTDAKAGTPFLQNLEGSTGAARSSYLDLEAANLRSSDAIPDFYNSGENMRGPNLPGS
ncbi:hypothetical protein WJX73_001576 [Symbiochloris irregularis]|uniref:Phosphatidic acid phosphatase type 2/haloperoxidase domain-containing protein n=1 Tax=Symbiochloris irregularis TaxID=706552 RepID=A0AAW1NXF5_9CHLO